MIRMIKMLTAPEPDDPSFLETIRKVGNEPKDFFNSTLYHLNEFRKHIMLAVLSLIVTSVAAFYFMKPILAWLTVPIGGLDELRAFDVTEPIGITMKIAVLVGFTIALPYICFEILLFVSPGIYRRARVMGLLGIPFIFLSFIGGILFTYYIMLAPALEVLLGFMGIQTIVNINSYLSFITTLMFWVGISFEFPIIAFVLSSMGILQPKFLRQQWRIAFVILAIFAAMVTPTVDPVNMTIVLLPLWTLYGLSILLAGLGARLRRKEPKEK